MRTLRSLIAALALIPLAAPVGALECFSSLIEDFYRAKDSDAAHELVSGRFTDVRHKPGDGFLWTATFVGFRASSLAFNRPFAAPVFIHGNGLNVFTGIIAREPKNPDGWARDFERDSGLIFLKKDEDGFHAYADWCPLVFYDARREKNLALACLRGSDDCPRPD